MDEWRTQDQLTGNMISNAKPHRFLVDRIDRIAYRVTYEGWRQFLRHQNFYHRILQQSGIDG